MKKFLHLAGLLACLALVVGLSTGRVHARLTGTEPGTDIWCMGPSGAEVCVDASGNFIPTTTNDTTLGSSSLYWAGIYAYDLTLADDLTVTDDMAVNGDTTLGNSTGDLLDVNVGTITIDGTATGLNIGTTSSDATFILSMSGASSGAKRLCIGCASPAINNDSGLLILGDGLRLGTGSTPDQTIAEDDMYAEGEIEVDGASYFDGNVTAGNASADLFALKAGTMTINSTAGGLNIGTSATDGTFIMSMAGDGTVKRVCIGCSNATINNDSALLVLGDGLRLGTGSTPQETLGEDDAFIEGSLEVDGSILPPTPAIETVASAGTITANACGGLKRFTANGVYTSNTTNTITAPTAALAGCAMDILYVGTDAYTLDANTNFKTFGGADVTMTQYDTLRVVTDGTYWYGIGTTGVNQ